MNQSALKTFAQAARRKLRDLIGARLDFVLSADTAELRQQAAQVAELRKALQAEGRDPLIERVAYTWFNRLAALRFMDANSYHPFGARVITPATANETLPEILQQARAGALDPSVRASLANAKTFDDLLAGRIPVDHPEAAVYRLLLVAACNYYHQLMPFLFEKIGDATELLLPEDLMTEHSIVADFRENLTDEDCQNEEVLGWFYQYYISEKKDEVMGRNAAVPKQDIPAVTQIFTPHWIVRYLVENSLGRLWLLNRPHSKLRQKMPYYIEGNAEMDFLKITKPEEIRLLDPAGGSGHMLTYAFDLLYAIYEEEGYDAPEIPGLILRHNLYGVDICDRAVALATFALCMKARAKDNRFFRRVVQPQLISLQEIRFDEGELSAYFKAIGLQPSAIHPQLTKLLFQFEDAKNFGSLIQPCLSEPEIIAAQEKLLKLNTQIVARDLTIALTHTKVLRVLEQADYLCQRYHVVIANPPYMGSKAMNINLKLFTAKQYPDAKSDLMTCFMERCRLLALKHGKMAMINLPSWLFLSSFEEFRFRLVKETSIRSFLHLGRGMFGSDFGSVAFVFENRTHKESSGFYRRLFENQSEVVSVDEIEARFHDSKYGSFTTRQSDFLKLPGCPIAYWISPTMRRAFEEFEALEKIADTRIGMATGKNANYVRFWYEVDQSEIGFRMDSRGAAAKSAKKWFPYAKGGEFRKWYGNSESVVDWSNDGHALQTTMHPGGERIWAHNFNLDQIFRPAICWTVVTIAETGFRYHPEGYIFDAAAGLCQPKKLIDNFFVLGALNSKVSANTLKLINPTVNLHPGYLGRIPIPNKSKEGVIAIVEECLATAKIDWDNFETSWDFRDLPFLRSGLKGATCAASWQNWKVHCDAAIRRMQELETENNRLFIASYGLQEELKPEVSEDQITLARADARKDMAAFLSYAVGCMMGRYSLDQPGLILAAAGATMQDYLAKVPKPTYTPDSDGIIPVLEGEWFTDDIEGRFREFLRITFGEATLAENISFIETSLGKELRKYFVKDFYRDHLKTYKKRPIYWMFSSPEGSFQALVYLHRYTRDTANLLLNDYVREFIGKLEEKHRQLTSVTLNESARPGDRTKAAKELGKIAKMLKEIRTWEHDVLLPLAQQRLEIDLDDGVKVNYLKFKGALLNIPGLDKGEED